MAQIFLNWAQIFDPFAVPTIQTDTQLVINNTDGRTRTVFTGTGFTYDLNGFPTGGAITSISLVLNDGDVVLQTLSNVDPTALADIGIFASQAFDLRTQISWSFLINQDAEPTVFTPTEIRLRNTDNTFTVVTGSGFAIAGENLSGTVTAIQLFDTDGTTLLDNGPSTGLPVSLALGASALFDEVRSTQIYLIANQGNNTLTSNVESAVSGPDTIIVDLVDGPGSDTIDAGNAAVKLLSWELSSAAITLDLGAGTVTSLAGNDSIIGLPAGGNVSGSDFSDVMTGNGFANFIGGGDGDDTLNGAGGDDTLFGGPGNDSLIGGAGIDTADYQDFDATTGVTVNLSIGTAQNTIGAGVDTLNTIENLRGGNFNDVLIGNAGANRLEGGNGNDVLRGLAGADTLDGGVGFDRASYSNTTGGITVDLSNSGNNTGDAIGDVYISIENLEGGSGNDVLTGDGGNNTLIGNGGVDVFNGGNGNDTADYRNSTSALTANLANALANTGDAAGETYNSIENLTGGTGADTLIGNSNNNFLRGNAGADQLDGAGGFDFADYFTATAGLTVTLGAGVKTGEAAGDVFTSIEGLRGSTFNDRLIGNANSNVLDGLNGADTLDGGAGLDFVSYATNNSFVAGVTASLADPGFNNGDSEGDVYISIEGLIGSSGNDVLAGDDGDNFLRGNLGGDQLDGGLGSDYADYFTATGGITVDLANAGNNTGEAAGDTYFSIERVRGGAFDDVLRGDANNNTLRGGLGADVLDGAGGFDFASYSDATVGITANLSNPIGNTGEASGDSYLSIEALRGSDHNDTLIGDTQDNFLQGGPGGDALQGGDGGDYADYFNATGAILADLGNSLNNTGEAAGDTYVSIERLRGGAFNDVLRGDANNNTLRGGLGADTLNGGAGVDFASYADATIGITASLATPSVSNTGEATGDSYISIEALRGSNNSDTLIGDAQDNFLNGGPGGDVLNGGAGTDFADYINATATVTVNLGNPLGNSGEASGDSYISIEAIRGSDFADNLIGNTGDNFLRGGLGADTLNGGAGNDWADYFGAAAAVTADLATGGTGGEATGDTYTLIENIRGSNLGDNLVGNTGDNFLRGGLGADTLNGGAGIDWADYFGAAAAVTANLATGGTGGEATGDTYTLIENIRGSNLGDNLVGNTGDNFLRGGLGADTLNGGAGNDWADYFGAATGVTANLATGGTGGEATGDTYTLIENIRGSNLGDNLVGNTGDNFLRGGLGADTLNGGAGIDWADYIGAAAAVTANLATGGTGGEATGDTYTLIENIRGSNLGDNLVGNTGDNFLRGGLGADTLNGGAGNDWADYFGAAAAVTADLATGGTGGEATGDTYTLIENIRGSNLGDNLVGNTGDNFLRGGLGADTLNGGAGIDWADYFGAAAAVTANLATGGTGGEATGDTYTLIENIRGSNLGDNLVGNTGDNFLRGGLGADTLNGGAGIDWADYIGAAAAVTANLATGGTGGEATGDTYTLIENIRGSNLGDNLVGNTGDNFLRGGLGADTLNGGAGNDWADYFGAAAAVTADLATGGTGGEATGDTYTLIENIRGSNLGDNLVGNTGDNFLRGGLGADTLNGGAGIDWADYFGAAAAVTANLATGGTGGEATGDTYTLIENIRGSNFLDILEGNAAANILQGGLGNDSLTGAAGADQFLFNTNPNSTTNFDIVTDFTVADDTIRLENAVFTAFAATGTIAADRFVSGAGAVALDANDNVIYDSATGGLFYDADGSGVGASIKFADIAPGLALTNVDFFII